MQRRPYPALPQTFLEQQPGGAGVSSGQERGKLAGRGLVLQGEKQGVPAARTS